MTPAQLAQILTIPMPRAENWCPSLNDAMQVYAIATPIREAAFLAQVGHESGRLVYVTEIWGPTEAQKRYEGREDLGNTQPGDGYKYRGRGLLQITGRANYAACRDGIWKTLGVPDFEEMPQLLEAPRWAAMSAAWYWHSHGLNELADTRQFKSLTHRINGGLNGYDERVALWQHATMVLA